MWRASVLSGSNPGPSPGPRDMANSITNTCTSLRLSTCSVPGPSCEDDLIQMIIITQDEGVARIPTFKMNKLRIREVRRLAQGP